MGRKNIPSSYQRCDLCDFATKNIYIYKRHKIRCRKEHGVMRGGKKLGPALDYVDGDVIVGQIQGTSTPTGSTEEAVHVHDSSPMIVTMDTTDIAELSSPESSSPPPDGEAGKKRAAVNRNYSCVKCDFKTNKSRLFLFHLVEVHKSNTDIYACQVCEYCSRYKHKIQKHMSKAHGLEIPYEGIIPDHTSGLKTKSPPVKKVISKPVSRSVPGRKLMVKFGKPVQGQGGRSSPSSTEVSQGQVVKKLSVPIQQTDQLARVVEEVMLDNGDYTYKCKECQFTNDDKQKVAKHAVSWHVDTKSFPCTHCDYITFERNDFMAHRITHRNEHQYKCEECTYSTDFRPNFDRHLNNHRSTFPFKCSFCSYGCGSDAAVRRHMASNHDPVPPAAKKVKLPPPKTYTSPATVSPLEPVTATIEQSSSSLIPAETSMSQETDEPDSPVEEMDQSEPRLFFQFDPNSASMVPRPTLPPPNMEHAGLLGRELSPQRKLPPNITQYVEKDEGKLLCPICKLKYKRSSDLNRHMKRKHGCKLREYLENFDDTADLNSSINKSGLSDMSIGEDYDADYSMLDEGDIDDDNNYVDDVEEEDEEDELLDLGKRENEPAMTPEELKCPYCPFQGKWFSDFKRHQAVHSVEKRYKCNYCPKKYKYIGDMNVHIRKDHNCEPADIKVVKVATIPKKKISPALFRCPCCDYTSAWKSEVDRHSRTHTGEKTFQCDNCDYQTFWRGDIRRHVYKHHPELMTDGVAINDVIKIRKQGSPDAAGIIPQASDGSPGVSGLSVPQVLDSSITEGDTSFQSMNSSMGSNSDYHTPLATPVKTAPTTIMPQHERSPDLSRVDMDGKPTSGHSPTPSPIKDLGGGMYQCMYCSFMANAPSKMNSHISTHTNLKRYLCPICGRRANWKWDISKHIKRDHSDHATQVIKLSKKHAEDTIKDYMEAHPVVRRDHHLNTNPELAHVETSDTFFKCSVCDFSAEKRISVTRHIRYMHAGKDVNVIIKKSPKKDVQATPPPPTSAPVESHIVQNMSTSTTPVHTPSKYTHLVENMSPQDAVRPFMCSECGKRGATKGDVKKHYHYLHSDKEIRIIYLGDGSQSVYSAKSEIGPGHPEKPAAPMQSSNSLTPDNSPQATPSQSPSSAHHPTSKHPKVLGYIRPFKCTMCGRRSNWRWDLNKHIREKHPGQTVEIITLSDEEARATVDVYVKEFAPELNKAAGQVPRKRKMSSAATSQSSLDKQYKCSKCAYRSDWRIDVQRHMNRRHGIARGKILFVDKDPAFTSLESGENHVQNTTGDTSQSEVLTQDSLSYAPTEAKKPKLEIPAGIQKMVSKGVHKQFKCSGCAYRSDWRNDVQRHVNVRHGLGRANVTMMDKETALATLDAYKYLKSNKKANIPFPSENPAVNGPATNPGLISPSGPLPPEAWAGLEKKIWKCSMCPYSNEEKVDVLKHLSKHNMKAYKCTLCNWTSNSKSSVQGHIEESHTEEEGAMCRLSIKLIKEGPGVDQSGLSIMPEGMQPSTDTSQVSPPTQYEGSQIINSVMFHCKLCTFRSSWRSCVCRHIRTLHKSTEYMTYCVKKVIRNGAPSTQGFQSPLQSSVPSLARALQASPLKSLNGGRSPRPKNFTCTMCPYRTSKTKMLTFHMRCHMPQPGVKQVKCKYCPYYVNGNRLLTQHTNLHIEDFRLRNLGGSSGGYPVTPIKNVGNRSPRSPATPKRHKCQQCPYTTNSKNDFMYHKQFHRPKPTADFKCDYCDYWVTHRRLIKQHMKVHEDDDGYTGYMSETASPSKSEYSENSLVYDTVEIAAIKQRIIASKITSSISQTPVVSPMKIASTCTMGGKRGFYRKDGSYRKVHKCKNCPYMNLRLRNMKLHELMHGKRSASHPLMKCVHCDYYVGSKGLLNHHMKVHEPNYGLEFMGPDRQDSMNSEDSEFDTSIPLEHKVDTLLEIARFKKFGCEKCPYATSKRNHFQRHVELHGSRQKCKCDFCDYSVPTNNLLSQHARLHFEPNQNLLAAQSILNLQYLPEMPADVALASMMTNNDAKHPVSITHDHIDLYENAPEDSEPKKLYRCDRCPYANIRRDHLLAHLRCHMTKNEFACPYCDYSVGKTHVLMQHVKVHFSPLPELSDWLSENGDPERIKEVKVKDIGEAIEVVKLFQVEKKNGNDKEETQQGYREVKVEVENDKKENGEKSDVETQLKEEKEADKDSLTDKPDNEKETEMDVVESDNNDPEISFKINDKIKEEKPDIDDANKGEVSTNGTANKNTVENTGKMATDGTANGDGNMDTMGKDVDTLKDGEAKLISEDDTKKNKELVLDTKLAINNMSDVMEGYICQYCDRDFTTSDCLVRHEMQHLIGNSYEDLVQQLVQTRPKPTVNVISEHDVKKTRSQDGGKPVQEEARNDKDVTNGDNDTVTLDKQGVIVINGDDKHIDTATEERGNDNAMHAEQTAMDIE